MRLSLYLGCVIPTEQYAYEICAREVLPRLGIELYDVEGASCCGLPLRGVNTLLWLYLSARNIALMEKMNMDSLALCNGCHVSFSEAKTILEKDAQLRAQINSLLKEEGLEFRGNVKIMHALEVLYDEIGLDKIKESAVRPIKDVKLAAFYGCHAIRPSRIKRPDDHINPYKMDELIQAIGGRTANYPEKTECCGAGLLAYSVTALKMAALKLKAIQNQGFDGIVTCCPYCHKMLDAKQGFIKYALGEKSINMPVFYYVQLLGLAMGIHEEKLGLNLNLSPIHDVLNVIKGE
jgi:heterodisulfide reductase subunit B